MKASFDKIALGITDDEVPLGSHLIHFWYTDGEFERGVRCLELGIDDESQYSVLFGHDEANERVLQTLRNAGRDLDRVIREGRLVILRRESSAAATLASIDAAFSKAVGKGAMAIRYLGNLGMGYDITSFWTSCARRRIWSSPSRSLPWRSAGQPVLRNRKQKHIGVAPAKHDR